MVAVVFIIDPSFALFSTLPNFVTTDTNFKQSLEPKYLPPDKCLIILMLISVQAYWDELENQLVAIVDELVPVVQHKNSNINVPVPPHIKHKLNERKRLLRSNRNSVTTEKSNPIKRLNKQIKAHFHTKVKKNVRRSIIPGNTQSLWKAVKVAKDTNTNELPNAMYPKRTDTFQLI